ncbi:MAG: hypothetical protein QNJ97_26380 [Myxococcota bacterium]|nr:hypothetical protein [Myxococcota bacterium]
MPLEESVYLKCGEDGYVYSITSCDEPGDAIECIEGQGYCVELSSTEAECQCLNHWTGEDCSKCPGNWDANQDCATCKANWDLEKDCEVCLGNWDINQNCRACENHWVDNDDDCHTCPGNWDASQECNVCIGNWDEAQDCNACQNGWIGDDCDICPEGWEADQDCVEVCGNGFITQSEECDDLNEVQWDGCDACSIVEFRVNTYTNSSKYQSSIAIAPDGRFIVVWESYDQDGDRLGIFGQRYEKVGMPVGEEFQINTVTVHTQESPGVAIASSGYFVVIWASFGPDGNQEGIFGQRYDAGGNPLGVNFQVNTYAMSPQESPSVAMGPDGRFVVVWKSLGQDGDGWGIFGQRYDAEGNPLGVEFQVNTYSDDDQENPSVAMAPDGRFIVVWDSYKQDGDQDGIFGQRYDVDGNPLGVEFQVNTVTDYAQREPSVAIAPDGQFVVTWQTSGQVAGQRYDTDGDPTGNEFRVNTYATKTSTFQAVAMASDGGFVVVWKGVGIYGKHYDASGNPIGNFFKINTHSPFDYPDYPAVAMAPDGRFVVAWSIRIDNNVYSNDVFAQRYDADGNPLGLLPW